MAGLTTRAPVVGRGAELARFADALAGAAAGRAGLIVVTGEAGIGKTRLVEAGLEAARADGWRVLTGHCLDIGEHRLPYLPFVEILRDLVRGLGPADVEALLGDTRHELAIISPELAEAAPAGAGRTSERAELSGLSQARLFERVLQLLAGLASEAPTVVVVEDVQWIDRATRDLLTFLTGNLAVDRLLIVLTCRTDGLAPGDPTIAWLAERGRSIPTTRVDLGRLPRDDVARQLEAIAGEASPPAVVDRIWRRSDGNPLFVEELFEAARGGRGDERPATLVEVLLARVAELSDASRRVLAALAVAGRPAGEGLLATVLEVPPATVIDGLRRAIEQGVVTAERDEGRFAFRHELLREVVEGDLLQGERRDLHERFAEVLAGDPELAQSSPAAAAAELAHHWAATGRVAEAYAACLAAGRAAEAVYAHAEAHRHFERAIELEPRLDQVHAPSPDAILALRRLAADAADFAGELDRAVELNREALRLVDPAADPETAGILRGRLGYVLWASGRGEASLAEHRAAVDLVPVDPPTAARARVLAGYAGALMGAARWAEGRDAAREAAETALAVDAPAEEARARNVLGSVLVALGELDEGVAELRRTRELATGLGNPDALVVSHHNLALHLLAVDRFEEGLREAEAGLDVARRTGLERRFGMDLGAVAGQVLLRLGRWDEADDVLRAAVALDPAGQGTVYLASVRARLAALRDDPEASLRALDAFDVEALDPDVAAELSATRADIALLAGRTDVAIGAVEDGLRAMEGVDDVLWTVPLLGLGLRAAADEAAAARAARDSGRVEATAAAAARFDDGLGELRPRITTATGRAWLLDAAASRGRLEGIADPSAFAAAASAWEQVPDPLRGAEARLREVEATLIRDGVRAAVADALRSVHATATSLGARTLTAAAASLATRARVSLDRVGATVDEATAAAPEAPDLAAGAEAEDEDALRVRLGLSSREMEVLALVAGGLSNGEIAERLFITRKTAAVHVSHIIDKLGVANRVEAAMVAERAGLRG